mgnify:CR=1 FL=1
MRNDPFDKSQDHAERSRMHEKFIYLFALVLFLFLLPKIVFAQSSYVLPYPSSMPGSLAYKFHLIYGTLSKYWYFGDFGQFDYNLKMTDKYLVEAKTLFEYKQFLLGYNALQKSDSYFVKILPKIIEAQKKGKNVIKKKEVLKKASEEHIEVLEEIGSNVPCTFLWEDEKVPPIELNLGEAIAKSINLRE